MIEAYIPRWFVVPFVFLPSFGCVADNTEEALRMATHAASD